MERIKRRQMIKLMGATSFGIASGSFLTKKLQVRKN
jgi:hypothetical protein